MLAAEHGSRLRLTAQGDDASDAVDALSDLVIRGFEEMEA
jgi:phosphotransferase system HPr-like phosphotransfer protein